MRDRLEEVRRGAVASSTASPQVLAARTDVAKDVTFAEAAAEYLRFAEQDRGCKPSTVRGYLNAIKVHLLAQAQRPSIAGGVVRSGGVS